MNFTELELELIKIQKKFTIFVNSVQANQLKCQLVPHFQTLNKSTQNLVAEIIAALVSNCDIEAIQRYSRRGGLEKIPLLRSYLWKILLGCLPLQFEKREQQSTLNYENYNNFIALYSFDSQNFNRNLWDQIMLDTLRTHPHIDFFKQQVTELSLYNDRPTYHFDILTRILYVWSSLSGVNYVQGMNQILAPLYYLEFQNIYKKSQSETFFMFSFFITSILDMHIKELDYTKVGIHGHIKNVNKYLKVVDFQIWKRLEEQKILPQFYTFRWLSLMLSQEFNLDDTIKLWDILLSHNISRRIQYLYSMCITIIILRKSIIMQGRYGQILQKLQKIYDLEVNKIIDISKKVFIKIVDMDLNRNLLKSQIQNKKAQHKLKR